MIALVLIVAIHASAASVESVYLDKLKSAQGRPAIVSLGREFESIQLLRRICDSQMNQGLIPWACYRALKKSENWRLIGSQAATARVTEFDRFCRRSARSAIQMSEDFLRGPESDLSPECRRDVLKAREIVAYRSKTGLSGGNGAVFEYDDGS